MDIATDAWYLVTARSDQLIASIKEECIAADVIRIDNTEVLRAAFEACVRARALQQRVRRAQERRGGVWRTGSAFAQSLPDPGTDAA